MTREARLRAVAEAIEACIGDRGIGSYDVTHDEMAEAALAAADATHDEGDSLFPARDGIAYLNAEIESLLEKARAVIKWWDMPRLQHANDLYEAVYKLREELEKHD